MEPQRSHCKENYTIIIHGKPMHEETRATFSHVANALLWLKEYERSNRTGKIYWQAKPGGRHKFYAEFEGQYSAGFDAAKDLQRIGVVNQTTMLASDTRHSRLPENRYDKYIQTD